MRKVQPAYAAAQICSTRRLELLFWLRLAFRQDTEAGPHQGAGPKDSVGTDRDSLPSERSCRGLLTALFSPRPICREPRLASCHSVQKRLDSLQQPRDY